MNNTLIRLLIPFFLLCPATGMFSQGAPEHDSLTMQHVFTLGEVIVVAKQEKEIISSGENIQLNRLQIASSLNTLPSITLANAGGRNEATIYLRGFDLRQIPVYLDGIPIYVAYDGYVDMARFTTFNLSQVNVSKGFSSILYGPNTLGGAINLISEKPGSRNSIEAIAGIMSGKGHKVSLNLGSKLGRFYYQLSISNFQKDYFNLSGKYAPVAHEDGGERGNSYNRDTHAGIKLGFTPNASDEYSVCFSYQHGEKGTPTYAGADPTIKLRYWQWPNWDKESLYFISNTKIGDKSYIKARLFTDHFNNTLKSYNDSSYTAQTKPYAFTSMYNDQTSGISIETGTRAISKNLLKFAFHFKNDLHSEHNLTEPVRHVADNMYSIGIEDVFELNPVFSITPGISYHFRNSTKAEEYFSTSDSIADFPGNSSHAWNEQISVHLNLPSFYSFYFNIAKKTRFATMKDRYSYKLGTAIPNPYLKPENAINLEIGMNGSLSRKFQVLPAVFYSRIYDVIQQIDNVEPGISQMQNAGTAEFFGGELTGSYTISEIAKAGLNYTFIQRKNISQPNLRFIDVPEHKLFGYLTFNPVKRIEITCSGEYNSKRYSTSYGNIAEGFSLFNVRIAAELLKYLNIETGMNNIFDKNYCLSEGYPEQGRNLYGSLIFKLN
jgi:iron complex outermembrane recepter protein